jgi:glycerophosphoryl diester phosphodiesterase
MLHKANVKLFAWTVNSISAMKKLRQDDVDGIITDFPDILKEHLK